MQTLLIQSTHLTEVRVQLSVKREMRRNIQIPVDVQRSSWPLHRPRRQSWQPAIDEPPRSPPSWHRMSCFSFRQFLENSRPRPHQRDQRGNEAVQIHSLGPATPGRYRRTRCRGTSFQHAPAAELHLAIHLEPCTNKSNNQ